MGKQTRYNQENVELVATKVWELINHYDWWKDLLKLLMI